jgi:hypothetical protein
VFSLDTDEKLAIVAALVVLGVTMYFAVAPVKTIANNVPIPTKTQFVLVKPKDAPNGTLHLHTTKPIPAGADLYVNVLHDALSETPAQKSARETAGLDAEYTRLRPFFVPVEKFPFSDWGTFAGARFGSRYIKGSDGGTADDRIVVGLRAAPFRLLYGTLAPDLLIAPHDLGLGISLYAPPDLCGGSFDHWGLGAAHLFSTSHAGGSSNLIYLSFSTFDF